MKSLRVRYSLRTLIVIATMTCIYLGAWEVTKRFGVKPNSLQQSPMPFVVMFDGIPHYKKSINRATLEMHCDRTYYFWCFSEQHELFTLQINDKWGGLNLREQNLLIKQQVRKRKNA